MRQSYWSQRSHTICAAELNAGQTGVLIEKCKNNNVTVNTILIATLLESAQKINKKNEKAGIAVSIRPNETNIGNFASGISIEYVYNAGKAIWENAIAVQALIKRKLKNIKLRFFLLTFMKAIDVNLIDSMYFDLFGDFSSKPTNSLKRMLGYIKKPLGLGASNLGKTELSAEYGIRTAYFIPPLIANTDKIVGIITTDSGMKIVYQYSNRESADANRQIFEDWVCRLQKL